MEWTAKYRPETLSDVRGNDEALRKLRDWAESWDSNNKSAVILHGRPGIGKTTAAHALANEMGWQAIEMNASEQRTSAVVEKIAGSAANMGTLTEGVSGQRLVVLDEADSLHGNTDRGGSRAMGDVVREAEQPVVLIANEYYEMSKSLQKTCEDIEFELVDARTIAQFLMDICDREGIEYTDDALRAIADGADGDVRGAVNDLQAVVNGVAGTLTVDDLPTGSRDRKENIFEYLDVLFKTGTPQEAHEQAQQVDETPDSLFNWIEDNITAEYDGRELWDAYDCLARADEWLGRVRASQEYKYWKYVNDQITAGVAGSRTGRHSSGWTRWGPPSFWQKLGRTKSRRKTRDSIARRIAETSNVSMDTAKNDILPFLGVMTHHCKNRELTVAMTAVYELDASDVSFITGSGEDTQKIAGIVEDAEEMRAEAAATDIVGNQAGRASATLADAKPGSGSTGSDTGSDSNDTDEGNTQQTLGSATDSAEQESGNDSDDDELTQTTLF